MKKGIMVAVMMVAAFVVGAQNWEVVEIEDLMAGTTQKLVASYADASQGVIGDPALGFRFNGDQVEAIVNWGGYSMEEETRILVRYGSRPVVRERVTLALSKEGHFLSDPEMFMMQVLALGPDGEVVIQATRATGPISVARWIVGDLAEKLTEATGKVYTISDSE